MYYGKKSKDRKSKKTSSVNWTICWFEKASQTGKNYAALAKLPKDANPNRLKLRDQLDGRPRGYMRKFGMSRIKFRELAHQGLLPGVRKASW